jgi:hypothetical protein
LRPHAEAEQHGAWKHPEANTRSNPFQIFLIPNSRVFTRRPSLSRKSRRGNIELSARTSLMDRCLKTS